MEERDERHGEDPEDPTPQAVFQLYDEEDAEREVWPVAFLEPRPQGPVQRHTAQHIVDILPYVQILDVLLPQMTNQVVVVLQKIDTPSVDILVPGGGLSRFSP